MRPLFLGGHPALDFVNTRPAPRGEAHELIADGRSYAAWLEGAGLLQGGTAAALERRLGATALDAAAAQGRELREWARAWIRRWQEAPATPFGSELRRLNQLMARGTRHPHLVRTDDGIQFTERWRIDSADALTAVVAAQIASLVSGEDPALVKQCAGPGCTLWFVDRTKARRRVFCSAAVCGNRAKVAAFRERQRSTRG